MTLLASRVTDNLPTAAAPEPRAVRRAPPGVFLMTDSFETGGSERQFSVLAKSLDSSLFDIHVGCLQAKGGFLAGFHNVSQFEFGGSLYKLQSLKARWRLARHLRKNAIGVAQAFDFYSNLALIPTARLARITAVVGSHRQIGDLLTPAQFHAQAVAFRWCDKVVCNSLAARKRLVDSGVSESILTIIGNGIPESIFAKAVPLMPRIPGLQRIGMIARMNAKYKNHHIFLKAAARLSTKFPNLEFVLVGDGPFRPELERLAEDLQIAGRTHFLGDRHDIPPILASLDAAVVPSCSESLSNAVLESMAAGVPVVASDVGGNPELLDQGRGLLVAANDDGALSDALTLLLTDQALCANAVEAARRFTKANFALEHIVKQYEALYLEILDRKNWRPNKRREPQQLSNRKIQVAVVAPSLRYVGGQSVQADLLLQRWQHDADVDARFIAADPPFPNWLKWAEAIPFLRTIIRQPIYLLELWHGLKRVDVAHLFSASYWSFLLAPAQAMMIARLRRSKVLINYHSGEARDHLRRSYIARSILARADRLVVPSAYLADVFHEFGLTAHAIPNFVNLEHFSFRVRQPLQPNLICTRGFHPYYRVDLVVRAFAEVQREFPSARLCIAGQGPSERQIRDLVRDLGIEGVTFAGVTPREQIPQLYESADIFINASCLDNMPVSIIEAFAAGTPVVTSNAGGIAYMVQHESTGLLSDVGDARGLAQNVIRLLKDEQLSRRIALGAYDQCKSYRWSDIRDQWVDVYSSRATSRAEPGLTLANPL